MTASRSIISNRAEVAAFLLCLLFAAPIHGEDATTDPLSETSTWITSIAPVGSTGQFVAGTANSLLLREAAVVSFSPDAPQQLTTLYSHPAAVWSVATTADGKTVASVDYRGNLVLFDMTSKKATTHEKAFERWCQSIMVAPDNGFVVAGNEAGKVMAWQISDKKIANSIELDGHAVTDLAVSPDGKTIAASDGDGHVHLLKWPGLESTGKIKISEQPAWCVEFVDNGKQLLIGASDRNLYRCAAKVDAKPESIVRGSDWITQLAISPSGQVAAAEVGGRVLFPPVLSQPRGGTESMNADSGVWALQWNKDAQLLVGTRKNGVVVAGRSWKWTDLSAGPSSADPEKKPAEPKHE